MPSKLVLLRDVFPQPEHKVFRSYLRSLAKQGNTAEIAKALAFAQVSPELAERLAWSLGYAAANGSL